METLVKVTEILALSLAVGATVGTAYGIGFVAVLEWNHWKRVRR